MPVETPELSIMENRAKFRDIVAYLPFLATPHIVQGELTDVNSFGNGVLRANYYYPWMDGGKAVINETFAEGFFFETTTHELGHMLDLVNRGKSKRLLCTDFGMEFNEGDVAISIKPIEVELNATAFQARLWHMYGYRDMEMIMDGALSIARGLPNNMPHGYKLFCSEYNPLDYLKARFEEYNADMVVNLWEKVKKTLKRGFETSPLYVSKSSA